MSDSRVRSLFSAALIMPSTGRRARALVGLPGARARPRLRVTQGGRRPVLLAPLDHLLRAPDVEPLQIHVMVARDLLPAAEHGRAERDQAIDDREEGSHLGPPAIWRQAPCFVIPWQYIDGRVRLMVDRPGLTPKKDTPGQPRGPVTRQSRED